jgi:hypothetical protein
VAARVVVTAGAAKARGRGAAAAPAVGRGARVVTLDGHGWAVVQAAGTGERLRLQQRFLARPQASAGPGAEGAAGDAGGGGADAGADVGGRGSPTSCTAAPAPAPAVPAGAQGLARHACDTVCEGRQQSLLDGVRGAAGSALLV